MSTTHPAPARGPRGLGAGPGRSEALAAVVGAAAAGAVAIWQPLVAVALVLCAAGLALLRATPLRRLAPVVVVLTALAAVAGPNLAAPPAPGLFLFRILIVLLGISLIGYLLLDGRLALPAGLPRPAGILAVWFLWTALSIGWAEDLVAALRWTSFMAMMGGTAIAIAILCRSPRRARILLWALFWAFVVACLVAVAEVLTGLHLPTFRAGRESREGLIGVGSLFGNQNNFATFLALALPYLLTLPVVYRDARLRLVGAGGGGLALLLILLTGSKSGLLAAGLVIVGLIVLVGTDRRPGGRLLAAVTVAGLAVVLVVPAVMGSGPVELDQRTLTKLDPSVFLTQVESREGSGGVRNALLQDGLALVGSTEGLGVGAGNAETHVRALTDFPGVANLHNWWLEVLVNGGLVGFGLYVLFYLTLLRRQARVARRDDDALVRYMATAGALAMLGWIVGSVGPSTAIHFAPMWIVFGLAMGALVLHRAQRDGGASSAS